VNDYVKVPAGEPVPLSVLALDLPEPAGTGWAAYLTARGIEVQPDDLGRLCISRAAARSLFTEQRQQREAADRHRVEAERLAVEADREWRARLSGGIPAGRIPDGVAPAAAMLQAAQDDRPRRRSVLEDALAGGGATYHPIRSESGGDGE